MEKGILGKYSRDWIRIQNNVAFDRNSILNARVPSGEKDSDEMVKVGSFDGEQRAEVMNGLEAVSNTVYRMLNGTIKPNVKIGGFVKNALNTGTFTSVFTPTVEIFLMDYIRPRLIVSNLLATTIPVGPAINRGLMALIRAFGLIKIQEVGKDQHLPIVSPNLGEYTEQMALSTKRFGVKMEIENELKNSDQWGILGYLMTQIGDGFRYRKETEVLKVLNGTGEVMYDNLSPATGTFGVHTGGRDINGAFNGTVTLEDIQRVIGYAAMRGNNIQYMLVHPFVVWNMIGDSELRNMVLGSTPLTSTPGNASQPGWDHPFGSDMGYAMRGFGGTETSFTGLSGGVTNPLAQFGGLGMGPLGLLGVDPHSQNISMLNQYMQANTNIPGANVTLLTSPQVPIKSVSVGGRNLIQTNMYLISDRKPVAILQESNPSTLEWEDIEMETSFMGFREKYTVIPLYQGRGVYTIKGAVIDKNYQLNIVHSIDSTLSEVGTSAPV